MPSIFPELGKPDNKTHIEVDTAVNSDIRDVLHKLLPKATEEARPLAKYFKGATPLETARNIWNYERSIITYKRDSEENQDIRMPRRFHHDKDGDCKTFSLNALAIYKAVYPSLPVAYKFTAYRPGAKIPSHVYAVVKDYGGNNIIIDGCYNFFNSEKKYTFTLPLKFDMQVRVLSGLELPTQFDDLYKSLSPENKLKVKSLMQAKLELDRLKQLQAGGTISDSDMLSGIASIEQSLGAAKAKKKHSAGSNALHWLDIATLAIGRGAFDAVIALNLNGLADKLLIIHDKYPAQWKKLALVYYDLGGYEKALLKAAKIGVKHKPLFLSKKAKARYEKKFGADARAEGLKGMDDCTLCELVTGDVLINGIAVAPAVAAVAATPVLAAIIPAIKKAFTAVGDTQNAEEMQNQGADLVEATKPGAPMDLNNPANIAIPSPPPVDNTLPPLPPTPAGVVPDDSNSFLSDIPDAFGLSDNIGDGWGDIGQALGSLFHLGMKKLKDKLNSAANVNPVFKQLGNTAIDGAAYVTNRALGQLGAATNDYVNKLTPHPDPGATKFHAGMDPMKLLLAAGAIFVGGKLLKVF